MAGVVESGRDHRHINPVAHNQGADGATAVLADAPSKAAATQRVKQCCQSGRSEESIEPVTFAARLNRLFDTIRPPGRGPLRNFEVLRELKARGCEMSAPYLSQLRTGHRSQPNRKAMRQLAGVFGVSVEYFTVANSAYTRYLDAELHWLHLAHDPQVRRITTALLTLPPDVREGVLRAAELAKHDRDDVRADDCPTPRTAFVR